MEHIKLGSDIVFTLMGIPFTNSVLAGFLCSLIIIIFAIFIRIGAGIIPTRRQLAFESLIDMLHSNITTAFGNEKRGNVMLYIFLTIFLFLLVANQFFVLPIISQIVVHIKGGGEELIPLFRIPTNDLSLPLVLAAVLILGGHFWAFITHPFRYLGHFIRIKGFFTMKSLGDFPLVIIEFFLGFMDIIGEAAKVVSLSARLFGNIFAGEVMYVVLTGLVAFIAPIPIVVLGLLTGLVQAFVFVTLSYQFMGATVTSVDKHHHA